MGNAKVSLEAVRMTQIRNELSAMRTVIGMEAKDRRAILNRELARLKAGGKLRKVEKEA